ncbi:site-specific integrase [Mesorhizobium sp. M7A.F.Ca.US.001.04.1.1]|uniref:site-specific integrase n=1 Tax=unclassified Mesorhizobium TaxID=325217 RepID=UPI000FC9FEDC|nr:MULTISPECIES: site-specific integrase [unclassified Mesorhizobium]RUY31687.1 site-specific integrase [Mesorhizobium sp. M7A.F.Ca.US.001.04.2.1]RUY44125.1 site-specific integrase [Mesorhizobium sp. M7A.F.Ca.US.001.04.1.1]
MPQVSYLKKQRDSGVYYAQIAVPVELQPIVGAKMKERSLRTKDPREAKRLMMPVIAEWNAMFDDIRARRALTEADKADAVWKHYTGTLDRDEQARRLMPTAASLEAVADQFDKAVAAYRPTADAFARRAKLDALRKHLAAGETALINHEVDAYAADNGLVIDPASSDRGDIARQMIRAEIEGLERTLERDRGDYSGTPRDPIVKPATGTSREQAKSGETIMELFEQYAAENPKGIATDTIAQARRDVGSFLDYAGHNLPAHRIDKKAVREWKALLMKFPVKATESKEFAGKTIAQIVRHNEKIGKPVITHRTVNRYLSGFSAFCSWLVNHGYLDHNPADGMFLKKPKDKTTVPFTTDQMNALFKSPLFTGCQSADEWRNVAKPGNVMIRDHRYWVPLIMLYSGARPAEIAQLAVADVRQEHGHWIFHITEEGDGEKSVKTAGSMRVVPVHDELIRLGFLKHHDAMKKKGEARLFPEAERNSRGQMIAEFSREFGRYLTRLGIKKGRGLSLYSFRHGAADALRRAGHLDEQFGFILGHASASMTGRYGIMPQGMLQQRVELVNSISYPGLNLPF